MTPKPQHRLMPTSWLAEKLGLSVSTVERLRSHQPDQLPPHVSIGRTIRYDERGVEDWLQKKMGTSPSGEDAPV